MVKVLIRKEKWNIYIFRSIQKFSSENIIGKVGEIPIEQIWDKKRGRVSPQDSASYWVSLTSIKMS